MTLSVWPCAQRVLLVYHSAVRYASKIWVSLISPCALSHLLFADGRVSLSHLRLPHVVLCAIPKFGLKGLLSVDKITRNKSTRCTNHSRRISASRHRQNVLASIGVMMLPLQGRIVAKC